MTNKIHVYSDFHTPEVSDGRKVSARPSYISVEDTPDAKICIGDGTQSKRRPKGFSRQDAIDELYFTLRDFADEGIVKWIPGNHDLAGDFNQKPNQSYIHPGTDDSGKENVRSGEDIYRELIDDIEGLEDLESQNLDMGDFVIVGGYNHEEPEFPRYADDVDVPTICDVDEDKYIRMAENGEEYAAEKLINEVISDISDRYEMPADQAVEDETIGDLVTEEEKEFVEMISDYSHKKLDLIDRLKAVEDRGKKAIITTHGVPNGKREGSEIDEIKAPIPDVNGKNYGSVVIEEVMQHFEDTVEAVVGGHIHEGKCVHEDGQVEYFGDIPVINPGNMGMVEMDLDNKGSLSEVSLHDVRGNEQRLEF